MSEKRYYDNPYKVDHTGDKLFDVHTKQLSSTLTKKIEEYISLHTATLKDIIKKRRYDELDYSIYTGFAGILLLLLKINQEEANLYVKHLREALDQLKGRRISFLCGDAGVLCMTIQQSIDEKEKKKLCKELTNLLSVVKTKDTPCEILYGLSGYLYALLLTRQNLGEQYIQDEVIAQVVEHIIEKGLQNAKVSSRMPLYFAWHEKQYVGAAHGYVGIFYMVLQAKLICPSSVTEKQLALILCCTDELLVQCFPSGNMRSSFGNDNDRLVQWCHGAPGAIHLYALAYKITKTDAYLAAAKTFSDVTWKRGLLTKGFSLCHGTAGNAYAFLCMFQLTQDEAYLLKAAKFAEWCMEENINCRTPDRPFSLYEASLYEGLPKETMNITKLQSSRS